MADYGSLVYTRAMQFALAQGADRATADAFAKVSTSISFTESGFDPTANGDNGMSHGLFQNHLKGRGSGSTVAQLRDPEYNIALSMPELWAHFRPLGAASFQRDPLGTVIQVERGAQRPTEQAIQQNMGHFRQGLGIAEQVAQGGAAPANVGHTIDRPQTLGSTAPAGPRAPVTGPITQGFGPTNEPLDAGYAGYAHFNKGLDFGVPVGTPVQSMTAGKVISTGDAGDGWGTRVWVQAPDGTIHNYGHLSAAQVKEGDTVQPGQVIAASGNTGKSTGPHLSYDVWKVGQNGQPEYLDPTSYMQGTSAQQGAGAMPTTKTPSATSALRQGAYDDLTAAQAREKELRAKGTLTDAEQKELADLSDPQYGTIPALRAAYLDFSAAESKEAKERGGSGLSIGDLINAQNQDFTNRFNVAQQGFTNQLSVADMAANMWQAGLTAQQNAATLGFNILNSNRDDVQKAVALAYERGRLDLNGATALIEAQAAQQAAQVGWAQEILARGNFIDETNYRNAVRMLPPGTEYQPALEPNSALNQSLARLNLNPIIIRAAQVPTGQLAPERSLASGQSTLEQSGLGLPQFDVQGVAAANERNQNLPGYTPVPITPEQVGAPTQFQNPVQLPGAPNLPQPPAAPFSYHDMIQALITGDSGGAAAPAVPPTDAKKLAPIDQNNPTNAPLGPNATRFIESEAQAGQPVTPLNTQHGSVWRGMPGQAGGPALGAAPEPQIAQPPQAQATPSAGVISVLDPLTGEIEDTYPDGRKVRRRPGPTPGPAPVARR